MQVLLQQRPAPVAGPTSIQVAERMSAVVREVGDLAWNLDSALRSVREAEACGSTLAREAAVDKVIAAKAAALAWLDAHRYV